jgi:hypothetical protein
MNLRRLERLLHNSARGVGDVNAARRGPDVLARRVVRREGTRLAFQFLRSLR